MAVFVKKKKRWPITKSSPSPLWGPRLPVTALVLSARRPFGPAPFACGLDNCTSAPYVCVLWMLDDQCRCFSINAVAFLFFRLELRHFSTSQHLICIVSSSLSSSNNTNETIFCALSTSFHASLWPCCDVCHQLGPCCIMASWLISSIPRQLSSTVMFPSDLVPRSDNIQHLVCGLLSASSQSEPRVFPWLLSSNHPTGLKLFCQTLQYGQNTSPITIFAARTRQKWRAKKVQEAWDTLSF